MFICARQKCRSIRFYGVIDRLWKLGCARFLWNRMLGDRLDLYRIMGLTVYNTPADYKDLDELFF